MLAAGAIDVWDERICNVISNAAKLAVSLYTLLAAKEKLWLKF